MASNLMHHRRKCMLHDDAPCAATYFFCLCRTRVRYTDYYAAIVPIWWYWCLWLRGPGHLYAMHVTREKARYADASDATQCEINSFGYHINLLDIVRMQSMDTPRRKNTEPITL